MADIRAEGVTPTPSTILPAIIFPKAAPAGKAIKVTYKWKAMPTATDYGAFVHITNSAGTTLAQDDHELSPFTSTTWSGPVSYTRNVIIPPTLPDGKYNIVAGLAKLLPTGWHNAPLQPAPGVIAQPGNAYLIGTFTVDHTVPNPPLDSDGPKTLDLTGYKLTFDDEFDKLDISPRGPGTR